MLVEPNMINKPSFAACRSFWDCIRACHDCSVPTPPRLHFWLSQQYIAGDFIPQCRTNFSPQNGHFNLLVIGFPLLYISHWSYPMLVTFYTPSVVALVGYCTNISITAWLITTKRLPLVWYRSIAITPLSYWTFAIYTHCYVWHF